MKVALLGGSFDPPHIGHVLIAKQVKERLRLDEIWLLPNYKHAFGKTQTNVRKRLEMCNLLAQIDVKISDFEIKRKGVSYTIDTLNTLSKKFPNYKFYWILGSDQLDDFQKYKDWKQIVKDHKLIIFPREFALSQLNNTVKKAFMLKSIPKNIIIMKNKDLALTNISSSMIRKRVKEGLSIKYLVTEEVEEYIIKNKLYK